VCIDGHVTAQVDPGFWTRWTWVRTLGAGTSGAVELIENTKTGIRRALKILGARFPDSALLREAEILRHLSESCTEVLRFYGVYQVPDRGDASLTVFALMQEHLNGTTLDAKITDAPDQLLAELGTAQGQRELRQFFQQLARQFQCIHEHDIVHQDVKLDNIMSAHKPGRPLVWKLIDFGLSERTEAATPRIAGAPLFMSPAKLLGGGDKKEHDLWAFGAVLCNYATATFGLLTEAQEKDVGDWLETDRDLAYARLAKYQRAAVQNLGQVDFYPQDPVMQGIIRELLANDGRLERPLSAMVAQLGDEP
jgi:serine/threonine protein kinase